MGVMRVTEVMGVMRVTEVTEVIKETDPAVGSSPRVHGRLNVPEKALQETVLYYTILQETVLYYTILQEAVLQRTTCTTAH